MNRTEIIVNWLIGVEKIDKKYFSEVNSLLERLNINNFDNFMSFLNLVSEKELPKLLNYIFDLNTLYSFSYKVIDFFSTEYISEIKGSEWIYLIQAEVNANKRFFTKDELNIFNILGNIKKVNVKIDLKKSFGEQFELFKKWLLDYKKQTIDLDIVGKIKKIKMENRINNQMKETLLKEKLHSEYLEKKESMEEYISIVKRLKSKLESDSLTFVIKHKREMTNEEREERLSRIKKYSIHRDHKIKEFEEIKKRIISFKENENYETDSEPKQELERISETVQKINDEGNETLKKYLEESTPLTQELSNEIESFKVFKNNHFKKIEEFETANKKLVEDNDLLQRENYALNFKLSERDLSHSDKENALLIKESKFLREIEDRRIEIEEENKASKELLNEKMLEVDEQRLNLEQEMNKILNTFKARVNVSEIRKEDYDKQISEKDDLISGKDDLISGLEKENSEIIINIEKLSKVEEKYNEVLAKEQALRSDNEKLISENEDLKQVKDELDELQKKYDILSKENSEATALLEKAKNDNVELIDSNKKLERFKNSSSTKLKTEKDKRTELKKEFKLLSEENLKLKEDNIKTFKKLDRSKVNIKQLMSAFEKEDIEISELQKSYIEPSIEMEALRVSESELAELKNNISNIEETKELGLKVNNVDNVDEKKLSKLTVAQLTKYAKDINITISRGTKKAEIISLILKSN